MLAAPCVPPTALVAAFRMTANFPQTGLWANFLPSRMRGRLGCFLCAPLQSSDCIMHLGGDADTPLLIGSESSVTPDHSSSSSSSGSLVELFGSIWLLDTDGAPATRPLMADSLSHSEPRSATPTPYTQQKKYF